MPPGAAVPLGDGLGVGVGVPSRLGRIEGTSDGDGDGDGEGVGAGLHSVPGRKTSFSEPTLLAEPDGDEEGEVNGEEETLELSAQGRPSTRPLGRWKLSTEKCAVARPLLMKSLSVELPTMLPYTPFISELPGPVCPTQAPTTRLGA